MRSRREIEVEHFIETLRGLQELLDLELITEQEYEDDKRGVLK